ncbi:histidine ammonia-lyase-like isoform X2 [Varroa jacobsoni]|uniref:Histidine ammonia-lyase n=1 Tax=Varroa destructor TaxID=109461 RepID=A0A7M7KMA1_VARDE|nr:histidine ammonia-lyase-like isoform X1 [Varroa destructor]XP_022704456.1 histidine ammonia-lyase-like isoform X2 [Varroa jacobsoni]
MRRVNGRQVQSYSSATFELGFDFIFYRAKFKILLSDIMMKVSVRVRGEWLAVPCPDPKQSISWLGEEALRRYTKLQPATYIGNDEKVFEIRKTRGGAILDGEDEIQSVLDNNDFVSVVLESDRPSPITGPQELNYVPEMVPGDFKSPAQEISIDGNNLSPEELLDLGRGKYKIRLSHDAVTRVTESRKMLEQILEENQVAYGINTGFGKFARVVVPEDKLIELQQNLVRSHAAGVGPPLSPEKARMLLALRINVLAKGYSGVSISTLQQLVDAFNANCLSWVPEQGTVGASGDLAPLAHLALGLIGEGRMWSPETGWGDAKYVLEAHDLKPIHLKPKEGLCMLNGTQLITSIGAEALERASNICRQADVVCALTLEVLKGTTRAFDGDIQKIRPHWGQALVAKRLRALLHSDVHPSDIAQSHRFCNRVQDAYTIRCCPQVHGIVHDTLDFVRRIITTEMNSATDNPLVFVERNEIISGGNFHGEYPAKALDYLAIAVHELASMSERRIERLINPALSELPAFLVKDGGLNSGFMLAHCTAASLVTENKVLCHPASIDSIPTSAGTEDHVSMGGMAARKALKVVENVEHVLAIELLAACQAIEFLRPLKTTAPLEAVYNLVRIVAKAWDKDRFMAPDIDSVTLILKDGRVWDAVKPYLDKFLLVQEIETRMPSPTSSQRGLKRGIKQQYNVQRTKQRCQVTREVKGSKDSKESNRNDPAAAGDDDDF